MRRPWIVLSVLLAACGTANSDGATTEPTAAPTVPDVGSLPETVPGSTPTSSAPLVEIKRPTTVGGEVATEVGQQVSGNRLLMIGDSIFAGTDTRYGGEMCAGLEPLGWAVEVAAEAGRFVEFGVEVAENELPLQSVSSESDIPTTSDDAAGESSTTLPPPAADGDWDAVALFLGSNYNGDQDNYDAAMRTILDRIAPRPALLYTVTEFRPDYTEVAEVIAQLAIDYPNVTVIDWKTAAETPGVLRPDGIHPNNEGEEVLVALTAVALGQAPAGEAECIRSSYRDDSAINEGSGTPTGGSTTGSTSGGTSSSSSTSGSSSSSTSGSSSSSTSGSSSSTTSGTGSSVTTNPPGTSPPATSPPDTSGGTTTGGSATTDTSGGATTSGTDTTGSATTTGSTTSGTTSGDSTTSGTDTTGGATTSGAATSGTDTTGGSADTTGGDDDGGGG